MPASKLVRPDIEFRDSYLEALAEYHAEGAYDYIDYSRVRADFAEFVKQLRSDRFAFHRPFQDWVEPVPETVLWLIKDGIYIGTVKIRHRLNWHLEKWGGHLNFIIRPSMRGGGFGKKILQKAMPVANYLGIDKALLTVAPGNRPAIRIIEFCGGVFEDEPPETERFPARRRYWLDCT
ncbi:MAG: GNAT family N-acetyltransferase [Alphaproteobacteria bacterium]|nr:GNAT family N-acetyltransferase [Alphaproteobacteria bacterium]